MIDTKAIRTKVLDLAFQGKLTDQRVEEGTGEELLFKIQNNRLDHTKSTKVKKLSVNDTIIPPFSIPLNWTWVRFSGLFDLTNGTASRGTSGGTDIPVLRLADLSEHNINTRNIRLVKLSDSEYKSHILTRDDLIIIRVNGSKEKVGRAYMYTDEKEISYCDHLFCGHPYSKLILPEYIMLALSQSDIRKQIIPLIKTTAGQNTINQTGLGKVILPFPPQGEQKRIVRLINQVFSVLDTIDDLQTRYAKDIDTLKAKLIENGLQGKLTEQLPEDGTAEELYQQIQAEKLELVKAKKIKKTQTYQMIDEKEIPFEIPNTWKWVRLGELCSSSGGKTPSMENNQYWQNGTVSWITSKDMKQKYLDTSEMLITEEAAKEMNLYSEGTVLMVVRSGILRRMLPVSILTGPSTINQDLKALIPNDLVLSEYLFLLLKGFESKILHKHAKEGTTVNSIRFEELLTMPVPLPPKPEQMRIVDRIDGILSII